MAIAIGSSGFSGGLERAAPAYTFADFPSLMAWFKWDEMTGTAIIDQVGNFVGTGSNIITVNGTGDVWTNAGAMTSNLTNNSHARLETGDEIPAAIRAIGSNPIIIELDFNITAGDHGSAFIELGGASSASIFGLRVGWNGVSSYPQVRYRGSTAEAGAFNATALTGLTTAGRTHLLWVWNRSASDTTGIWNIYRNGILTDFTAGVTDYVPATDPGPINIAANGSVGIGNTTSFGGVELTCQFFNTRIWMPSTIPANMATIALDLGRYPERLPDSAKLL